MPAKRALVLFVLCASAALAADPPELKPLKGEKIKGDLVGLTDKEIVLQIDGKRVATPVEQTLQLDFRAAGNPTGAYTLVELTDGSALRCSDVTFTGKEVTAKLLSGQTVSVPLAEVALVMKEAHDVKRVAEWKELFSDKKRNFDSAVRRIDGALKQVEGTFYDVSENGKSIDFVYKDDEEKKKRVLPFESLFGLVFNRPANPNLPARLCELLDAQGAKLYAKSVVLKDGKLAVQTQCGAKVEYPVEQLARLDFSKGKLEFLSGFDLARIKVVERTKQGLLYKFRRDQNIEGGPIRLGGKSYAKGLALHDYCELTFDLDGEYREFKAVAGVNDLIGQGDDKPVSLKIYGNNDQELLSLALTKKDGVKPINLNIKDVQKLKIIVSSPPENILGLGCHLDLGDAQVSK